MPLRILRFAETVDGVTYTARTNIPKGARLLDILMETTVGWTAATASLDVGDSDGADSLINGQDISNVDGVTIDSAAGGTYWASPPNPYSGSGTGKLYPAGDSITAVVTATVPGGPTGLSSVALWFEPQGAGQLATVTT
jgi:hypothetical protein